MNVSVSDLIEFLKTNFDREQKLCYLDCVQGVRFIYEPVHKSDIGVKFFKQVSADKTQLINSRGYSKQFVDDMYEFVNDSDVVINV